MTVSGINVETAFAFSGDDQKICDLPVPTQVLNHVPSATFK
jgi:hypothetical protein